MWAFLNAFFGEVYDFCSISLEYFSYTLIGFVYVATSACNAMAVSWLRRIVTNFPMCGFKFRLRAFNVGYMVEWL
jgi:hypothetical protein